MNTDPMTTMKTSIQASPTRPSDSGVPTGLPNELQVASLRWLLHAPLDSEYTIYHYGDDLFGSDESKALRYPTFDAVMLDALRFQELAIKNAHHKPFYAKVAVKLEPMHIEIGGHEL